MRGDRYRDALTYVASLDVVLDLAPERLITGHFDPIEGADRIAVEVVAMRDATQWVHDRTVEGMNAGKDVHTLMSEVTLPEPFDLGEGYGKTQLERAGHLGELRRLVPPLLPTGLYGVPPAAVAPDLVAAAGADALAAAARAHLDAGGP